MSGTKQQWKKRVEIFRFIFSILMLEIKNPNEITKQAFEKTLFDNDQLKMIDYFAKHQSEIIAILSQNLSVDWTWERIPQTDKAILIAAFVEHKTTDLHRKIIIDQALVTIKHFSTPNSVKYINAILNKIIN